MTTAEMVENLRSMGMRLLSAANELEARRNEDRTMYALLRLANHEGIVRASVREIAKVAGCSHQTVTKHLRNFVSESRIERLSSQRGRGVYRVRPSAL